MRRRPLLWSSRGSLVSALGSARPPRLPTAQRFLLPFPRFLSSVAEAVHQRFPVLSIGCPKELREGELRVGVTPEAVRRYTKAGLNVIVEKSAGDDAGFTDADFEVAGATIAEGPGGAFGADIVVKIEAPVSNEVELMKDSGILVSFFDPENDTEVLELLLEKKATLLSLNCIPRTTRAQTFDALSSMANVAGYRAVVEAAHAFGRFLGGQITAAGRIPPAKVLVIGGGVAGLASIGTAKSLGAIVRCFDTRPAVREEVESLGAEFLEVDEFELEEGVGGYAKEMSPEFLEAERRLFMSQCTEVDIIITSALIPGKKAPVLISRKMVEKMKGGSVIIDLAANAGGNTEMTERDRCVISENGVKILGCGDLPNKLPAQSSVLLASNISKFLTNFLQHPQEGGTPELYLPPSDDIARGSAVVRGGELRWPPDPPVQSPAPARPAPPEVVSTAMVGNSVVGGERRETMRKSLATAAGAAALLGSSLIFPVDAEMHRLIATLALSGAAGRQAVVGVAPALHTPLMGVTNAISGVTAIGGIILLGHSARPVGFALAAVSIVASLVNICGGFVVTHRMLEMFRRPSDPPPTDKLFAIPAAVMVLGHLFGAWAGAAGVSQMTYLAASLCCLNAIAALASQKTARSGNALGVIGVAVGVLAALAALPPIVATTAIALLGIGSALGVTLGRRIQVTQLPQAVAGFHSLVGLAAMATSIGALSPTCAAFHKAAGLAGAFIGGLTLTGSVVAFGKLSAMLSSSSRCLRPRHLWTFGLLAAQCAVGWAFMLSSDASVFSSSLTSTVLISLLLGAQLVGAVGGGDMPVCVTMLNSLSGWALVAEGLLLHNTMMTIVGSLIGFSGAILSQVMCRAMNRSLLSVVFSSPKRAAKSRIRAIERDAATSTAAEAAAELLAARKIIVVPGYGMAVARAQYAAAELARILRSRGLDVKFAVHPVAGRMPGQMNVLLAEAGVPYDWVYELDSVNQEFPDADVSLVVGANDITNSSALDDPESPIAGMPVLEVWRSRKCLFMKRSLAAGYADIENPVFFNDNTSMILGDAKLQLDQIVETLRNGE